MTIFFAATKSLACSGSPYKDHLQTLKTLFHPHHQERKQENFNESSVNYLLPLFCVLAINLEK